MVSFLMGITGSPQKAEAQAPDPGTLVFYHSDHLGSTTAITDATGRVLQLLEYDPWGQVVKDIGDNYAHYRYTGQEYDPEIGLYNYKARLYAAGIGRFISADPIVSDPANPQALNRYAYVLNNPMNLIDPSGHGWWKKFWKGAKETVIDILSGIVIITAIVIAALPGGIALTPVLVSIGMGMLAGGVSAYIASGGNWTAVLHGMLFGGAMGAIGGVAVESLSLGGFTVGALTGKLGTYGAYIAVNATEGAIYGGLYGLAAGYKGGLGTEREMLLGFGLGALIGGVTGAAVGALQAYIAEHGGEYYLTVGKEGISKEPLTEAGNTPITAPETKPGKWSDLLKLVGFNSKPTGSLLNIPLHPLIMSDSFLPLAVSGVGYETYRRISEEDYSFKTSINLCRILDISC
jgi:RHS repeat-associated protein